MGLRRDRLPLGALASGVLLALAFPRPDLAELAWVGLVPLLLAGGGHPFRQAYIAGSAFFALVLYWLNIVMTTYGGLHPVFSLVAYLLLVAYLALFFAVPFWAACRLRDRLGYPLPLTLPVLWVGFEFLRSFLFSGFPWATLGYSQQSRLLVIQSADLFGVYGLSFLLVLANTVIAALLQARLKRDRSLGPRWSLAVLAVLAAANLGYGAWRLGADGDTRPEHLDTILVQGNIDQSIKWNPAVQQQTVTTYRDLSLAGVEETGRGGLIIWPESATPFYFQDPSPLSGEVTATARSAGSWLLFGSPAYERVNRVTRYLNSAFLLGPDGEVRGRSDKVHLVPFGEYVPLGRWFPFIDKLVVGIGDFSPGTISPLTLDGHRVGVLVCFEGIFPELARDSVRLGSDLLVNITNDAWFGRSSAPYQHLAMTRFRAVENRIWVARAANTGVSALIAPSGRITAESGIFETALLKGRVGFGAKPSLYTRWGDLFPALFMGLSLFWLYLLLRRSRLQSSAPTRRP